MTGPTERTRHDSRPPKTAAAIATPIGSPMNLKIASVTHGGVMRLVVPDLVRDRSVDAFGPGRAADGAHQNQGR